MREGGEEPQWACFCHNKEYCSMFNAAETTAVRARGEWEEGRGVSVSVCVCVYFPAGHRIKYEGRATKEGILLLTSRKEC